MSDNERLEKVLARPLANIQNQALVETAVCTVIAVVVPAVFAHTPSNQFIVGPVVNAILFWVALRVGIANALFIAVVPSLIALFRGLLPPSAAAAIPFIILGNCAMIITFVGIRRYSVREHGCAMFLQIFLASLIKTLIIFLPVWLFLNSSSTVTLMMSWPQLATAMVGGFLVIVTNRYFLNNIGK